MFLRRETSSFRKSALNGAVLLSAALALSACSNFNDFTQFDPKGNLDKSDYESLISRKGAAQEAMVGEPPIPDLQPVIAAPGVPELADTRRVSIAVAETTPLRDLFIELARKAGVDLKLDPGIEGGIIYSANDRPFLEVIENIVELAELRYDFEGNVLTIERDTPYFEYYQVNYPNQTRSASTTAASSVNLSDLVSIGGGGGATNSSEISLQSESQANFWQTIEEDIGAILGTDTGGVDVEDQGGVGLGDVAEADEDADPDSIADLVEGAEQADLELEGSGGDVRVLQGSAAFVSVNRQSGLITVFGNRKSQVEVEEYLRRLRASTLQQVLIEAKIVEVVLEDQYRTGIDWNYVFNDLDGAGGGNSLNLQTNFTRDIANNTFQDPSLGFVINNFDSNGVRSYDLNTAVNLVSSFGSVRTLSSPRITVINNQTALLRVAENEVFFELEVQEETDDQTNQTTLTIESQIQTVPVGLTMGVQPFADPNTAEITMNLRPTITRITRQVDDPGVSLQVASINAANNTNFVVRSLIPVVEIREVDSILRMNSGQVVVMGGLMQERNQNIREGLPGLADIPIAGQAFGQRIRETEVSELIIFIKATLVEDRNTVDDYDVELYNKFAPDPRPIAF